MYSTLCCLVLIICSITESAKIPRDLQKCKHGDNDCIKNSANNLFETKSQGYPEINLINLNPVQISAISISQGKESPVNIDLRFRDNELEGVNTLKVYKISGFGKDLKGPHEVYLKAKVVILTGPYQISGKVLLLPISGNGKSNITIVDPDLKLRFKGEPVVKNNKTYMNIQGFKMNLELSRMYLHLDNLFNGDKALGDTMNAFLNDNWQDIYSELRGSISKAFGMIFEKIIQNVFDKIPYEELFVEE